jgi:flagellar export protein FliJ
VKRFGFSLERVLWHRRLREEAAEQALAGAFQRERAVSQGLTQVRDQAAQETLALERRLGDQMTGVEFLLHAPFAAALREREAALRARCVEAATETRERRDLLLERRREREVVSQLRQRAWERYRQGAEREAQLAIDEVAGGRHSRRGAETEE